MRRILFLLSCLLVAIALSAEKHPSVSAQEPDKEFRARMEAIQKQRADLQKQLEDLAKKEQALRDEMAEKAKEREYYIKVEVKGRLGKGTTWGTIVFGEQQGWVITAQGVSLELDLSKAEKFVETVKAFEGKSVQITGTVVSRTPQSEGSTLFLPVPVLVVTSLKAAE
jgi:hypothetical protein